MFCFLDTAHYYTGVLPPKRGDKVKRVSKLFQQNQDMSTPTGEKTTPTMRLHPAIQAAIESYPFDEMNLVQTEVKLTLPTAQGEVDP